MLYRDVKIYLIVSRVERCPKEEYAFRNEFLKDFVAITGDIPSAQLQKAHFIDFIKKENETALARGLRQDYLLRAKFTLERFLLWLRTQPAHPVLEPSERN